MTMAASWKPGAVNNSVRPVSLGTLFFLLSVFPPPLPAKTLDSCFSPLGHCDQVMVSWINAATKTLDGAIYGLTDPLIGEALIRARKRGVAIRIVHDKTQAAGRQDITDTLQQAGIPVHVQRGTRGGIQHNKFLVIDRTYVLTGSFNWTQSATHKNDENFVVLDDQADAFEAEFERLWSRPPPETKRKP
jgi:mitochondrial cardiolipin hydrolase